MQPLLLPQYRHMFDAAVMQVSAASGRSDADSEPLEERELMALGEVMDHSDGHVRVAQLRGCEAPCRGLCGAEVVQFVRKCAWTMTVATYGPCDARYLSMTQCFCMHCMPSAAIVNTRHPMHQRYAVPELYFIRHESAVKSLRSHPAR